MKLGYLLLTLMLASGCLTQNAIIELPPIAPSDLTVSPDSPASDSTPTVSGTTSASVSLVLYSGALCTGHVLATGQAATNGAFALTSGELPTGTYQFSVQAINPNGKTCSLNSVAYDLTATVPAVSVSTASASLINSTGSVNFTVTYTEADTVNLSETDILFSSTGTATCSSILVTNGTTTIPMVTLSGCTGDGTLGISIGPGTAENVAGSALASNVSGTFVVDNTGISTATFDQDTGSYSTMPSSVIVTFNEAMAGTTLTVGDFSVSGTCSVLPNLSITETTTNTATLSLTAPTCAGGETVALTLDFTTFTDAASNAGTGALTVTYTYDNAGPASASYNPVAGNINTIPASIDVIFSEPIEEASLSSGTFVVSGNCDTLPTATLSTVVSDTATVDLSGGSCLNTQEFTISIDLSTVNDAGGLPGSGTTDVTYIFDDVGPAVISASPVTASVSSVPGTVDFTFDESVLIDSVAPSDLSITGTCSVLPTASLASVASGTTMSFSLSGATCATGETVTVTLDGASITDAIGNVGSGTLPETYTIDTTGPSVASFGPIQGAVTTLPPSVLITFDEDMNTSTVTLADIDGTGGSCTTLPTLGDAGTTATTFTVSLSGAVCTHGQTFTLITYQSSIEDVAGNTGVGSSQVTYTIDTQGPVAGAFAPAGGVVVVPTSISLSFDEDVDAASVSAGDFSTVGSTCTGISVDSANTVGGTVTVGVTATCASGQILSISADGSSFLDILGNVGSGSASVNYTQP